MCKMFIVAKRLYAIYTNHCDQFEKTRNQNEKITRAETLVIL